MTQTEKKEADFIEKIVQFVNDCKEMLFPFNSKEFFFQQRLIDAVDKYKGARYGKIR